MTIMVIDTETTGLGKTDEVIELAIIQQAGDAAESVVLHARYRPRVPISDEARAIHGIADSDITSLPTIDTDRDLIIRALEHDADLVVGHNVRYDLRMLSQSLDYYLVPRAIADTKMIAKQIAQGLPADLGSVYSRIVGSGAGPNHSALQDARATLSVWRAMMGVRREPRLALIESQIRRMVTDAIRDPDTYTARHCLLGAIDALIPTYPARGGYDVEILVDLVHTTMRDEDMRDEEGDDG